MSELRYRYYIRLQKRAPLRPGGDPTNWRHWRIFAVVPILFDNPVAAWDYWHAHGEHIFRDWSGRKVSASVQVTKPLPDRATRRNSPTNVLRRYRAGLTY